MTLRCGLRLLVILAGLSGCRQKVETISDSTDVTRNSSRYAKLIDVPQDRIFVAGEGIEVIDAAAGQVVGGINWETEISEILFTQNGLRGFAASSSGVFEFDPHKLVLRNILTNKKAVSIRLAQDDDKIFILESISSGKKAEKSKEHLRLSVFDLADNTFLRTEPLPKGVIDFIPSDNPAQFSFFKFDTGSIAITKGLKTKDLRTIPQILARSSFVRSRVESSILFVESAENSSLVKVNMKTGQLERVFTSPEANFSNLIQSNDGQRLLLAGPQSSLILQWSEFELIRTLKNNLVRVPAAFSIDRRRLYYLRMGDEQKNLVSALLIDRDKHQGDIPTKVIRARVIAVHPRSEYAALQRP